MTRHDVADESDIENAPFYGKIQEPATPENVRAHRCRGCSQERLSIGRFAVLYSSYVAPERRFGNGPAVPRQHVGDAIIKTNPTNHTLTVEGHYCAKWPHRMEGEEVLDPGRICSRIS